MCLDLEHIAFLTMSTGDDHHFGQPHIVDETSRSISVFFLQNSSIFESGPSYYFWFLEHFLPFLEALDFSADLEIRRTRKWQNHILSAKEFCFRLPSPKLIQSTHQPMARLADTVVSQCRPNQLQIDFGGNWSFTKKIGKIEENFLNKAHTNSVAICRFSCAIFNQQCHLI